MMRALAVFSFVLLTLALSGYEVDVCSDGLSWVFGIGSPSTEIITVKPNTVDGCHALRDVVLPEQINGFRINGVGSGAFAHCDWLRKVTIGPTYTQLLNNSFAGCSNLEEVVFCARENPALGLHSIGDSSFKNCIRLSKIELPETVSMIGREAFSGCSRLKSIRFPNSLYSIDAWAFADCGELVEITLPPFLKSVCGDSFAGCLKLKRISADCVEFESADGVLYHRRELVLVCCPGAYSTDKLFIKDGTLRIMPFAFVGCSGVNEVYLPSSLTMVDAFAFAGTQVKRVNLSEEVKSLGCSAFLGAGFEEIVLPSGVKSIGRDCFMDCHNLRRIVFKGDLPVLDGEFLAPSNCVLKVEKSLPSWKGKTSFGGCRIE